VAESNAKHEREKQGVFVVAIEPPIKQSPAPPKAGFFIALEPGRHGLPRELKKTRIFRQLSLTLLDIEKLKNK